MTDVVVTGPVVAEADGELAQILTSAFVAPPSRPQHLTGPPGIHLAHEPLVATGKSRTGHWVIGAVLAAEVFGSLRLRNSVFQDEALYLWAGHQLTAHFHHGTAVYGSFTSYFSGSPGLYPVIASVIDGVAGLAGARLMSLAWMVAAMFCVYGVTRRLFRVTRAAPAAAAAAFALSAPILFIGHLATYDSMCLGLLALATYAAVRGASSRWPCWALLVGPLALMAVLSKYAGALFVPTVFGVLVLETRRCRGWWAALGNFVAAMVGGAVVGAVILQRFGTSILAGIQSTTTSRTVLLRSHPWPLITHSVALGGAFVAVALIGCIALPRRQRLLGAVLFGAVLLAPAYHVYRDEPVSLAKHIGFGMFFAAPLVGRALCRVIGQRVDHVAGRRFAASVAVGLVLIAGGFSGSSSLYHEWSNSDQLVLTLRSLVRPASGRILAEEAEVPRYRLHNLVQPWQWSDLNWFEYTDHNRVHLTGLDAYRAAIHEHYFDVIVLRFGANAATALSVKQEMDRSGGYQLVERLPFTTTYGPGAYWIWHIA